ALSRLSPDFLYNELVTVLLNPSIRSLGALSFEQISDTLPSLLPVGQSILLVWQDIIAIVAATLICFGISYAVFCLKKKTTKLDVLHTSSKEGTDVAGFAQMFLYEIYLAPLSYARTKVK